MTRLVVDLLDVSRIARGKVALQKEPCELAEIVAKAIELSSPLLEQKRHKLSVSVPERGLLLEGDRTRLTQVISNLLTNAARYTEPGGSIELAAMLDGAQVVLEVRDDGVGIAPSLLTSIFDLFVQEKQSGARSQGGLGLGLAIAKNLTTLHNGTLTARSEGAGKGSTFELRLPALEHDRPTSSGLDDKPARLARANAGRRILLVDDNVDLAEMLGSALRASGHSVVVAYDGPSALGSLERFRPQIAVLDLGLPLMDGFELAQILRDRPGLEDIGLIALTGYGQESDKRSAHAAGFDAHLVKPCSIKALNTLIGSVGQRSKPPASVQH